MANETSWAVQPAAWFKFDPHGAVYCADIDTAYKICKSIIGEGDPNDLEDDQRRPYKMGTCDRQ